MSTQFESNNFLGEPNVQELSNGASHGTRIGRSSVEKIGFSGATPVAPAAAIPDATTAGETMANLNTLLAHMRAVGLVLPN